MGEDGVRRDDAPFSSLGCHRVTERWHAELNNEALDAARPHQLVGHAGSLCGLMAICA
jgi:hypothetical protein